MRVPTGDSVLNKKIFDVLKNKKQEIEKTLDYDISWERLDNARMSRIAVKNEELSLYDKDRWNELKDYLKNLMIKFESVFKQYANDIKKIKIHG